MGFLTMLQQLLGLEKKEKISKKQISSGVTVNKDVHDCRNYILESSLSEHLRILLNLKKKIFCHGRRFGQAILTEPSFYI
jgi:hypothetical protein